MWINELHSHIEFLFILITLRSHFRSSQFLFISLLLYSLDFCAISLWSLFFHFVLSSESLSSAVFLLLIIPFEANHFDWILCVGSHVLRAIFVPIWILMNSKTIWKRIEFHLSHFRCVCVRILSFQFGLK